MSEDHSRRIELQCSSNDDPGINASTIDSASEELLEGYQPVLAIHEHTTEVLVFLRCDMELAELPNVRRVSECLGCL